MLQPSDVGFQLSAPLIFLAMGQMEQEVYLEGVRVEKRCLYLIYCNQSISLEDTPCLKTIHLVTILRYATAEKK